MNKKLEKVFVKMMSKNELFLGMDYDQMALFPSDFVATDGKDFNELNNSKDCSSFAKKDAIKALLNKNVLEEKIEINDKQYDYLKGYPERINLRFGFVSSYAKSIASSIKDLIPTELDGKDKKNANAIRIISLYLTAGINRCQQMIETSIGRYWSGREIQRIKYDLIVKSFVELNYYSMLAIFWHQNVYEYFYGPKDKHDDIAKIIKQVSENNLELISSQLKILGKSIEEKLENIDKKGTTIVELESTIISNQVADKEENRREHVNIQEEMNKKQRLERTRPLFLTTCLDAIIEEYNNPKYNYSQQFKLHPYAIRNQLSAWNQHLTSDGLKGEPPLPEFDSYRHTDKEMFKKWVRDVFFPDYRNRAHKDALTNASHPKNMDNIPDPNPQDIIDEIDESLANDDHHNPDTNNK